MLKIKQIFPKLYRGLLYVVFRNLELQNAGLVDVFKDLNFKQEAHGPHRSPELTAVNMYM